MTTRYVDPVNGNNAWDGLAPNFVSGTNGPKASLNGAEDSPIAAGDLVHCRTNGPYRETLTVDVSGTAGNPIEYRMDVAGVIWPPGGIGRLTGSDNDQTATRSAAITASSKNYRTFTGFLIDTTTGAAITPTDCTNWIIQDCTIASTAGNAVTVAGASQAAFTIRRLITLGVVGTGILFSHTSTVDNAGHLVENCLMTSHTTAGVRTVRIGGVTVKNSTFIGVTTGLQVTTALTVGQTFTANNCIVTGCVTGLAATTTAEFSEDYNSVFANGTARSNVTAGANSVAHSPLFAPPILLAGIRYPWMFGALSQWSTLAAKAGTSEASDDLLGTTRPTTSSKKSWGAVQFVPALRDTGTVRTGAASLRLSDAGRHQMFVPVTNVSTVFSLYVQWESDYAGTKPQVILSQPGQSDITLTATGSAGSWEQLTHTWTPAASPPYVVVTLVSSNTATSGNYDCFWDDLSIS